MFEFFGYKYKLHLREKSALFPIYTHDKERKTLEANNKTDNPTRDVSFNDRGTKKMWKKKLTLSIFVHIL